ncbi:putative diguanylate cyclase/phosphodiesterase (GGDEF & EAL domains) with PAS/PAC sensor(S) [uncultured Alphaproteobacteria bacterium]|uniref:Putative diguanylate cyclase/phosphodiesterase (GGDEF & EAL domains) with PAS/PAC sensor(S) n=1 Tax=uncultured Alphaproteobacteria bacterium TaxID=91750 RepID=A0A212KKK1_9PROT|nr:putative diguanylate cyclase/phosphodiesterase (GGDEF & EAL domains) with PAS/PAC sensor(S) [uncultured Alphaproteobacteria bacterium]
MVALVFAVAVLTGFAMTAAYFGLDALRTRDLRRAEITARDLAQAVGLSVGNTVDKIDISLLTVAGEIGNLHPDDPRSHRAIRSLIARQFALVGESEDFSVTDADGVVRFHGGPNRQAKFSVADRAYFRALAEGRSDRLEISRPLTARVSGEEVLVFARAYKTTDGGFGGIVAVPVKLSYFRQMIAGYALGPHDRLALMANDATPIVTERGTGPLSPALHAALGAERESAVFRETVDGKAHIVAVRRLGDSSLRAVCAITEADYLAEWRRLRVAALGGLGAFIAFVVLVARELYRAWTRQRRHALALATTNARLASALRKVRALDAALIAACDVGGLGTFTLDLRTGIWTASSEQEGLFGIDSAYPHTRSGWDALIHPEDLPRVRAYFDDRDRLGSAAFDIEFRIHRPRDGALRWIHGVGRIERHHREPVVVGAVRDVTDAKAHHERIEYLAQHDSLTDLPNRTLLADRMRQALAARRDELVAVCYLDLDGFKPINDLWGHDVGDLVLMEVAHRLIANARAGDTVARMGGDEFVVLLCGLADTAEIEGIAARLLDTVARPYTVGDDAVSASASIGIAVHRLGPAIEPDALIRQADQAMYEAKRKGRNRFHVFDPERDRKLLAHQAQASRMAAALAEGEFRLHFQPRVDLRGGAVDGVEALLRWQHPERGLLPPAEFLSEIENSDLAPPLGEWILREALRHRQAWRERGLDLTVAVNLFGRHLQQPDFVARLAAILAEFPSLPPAGLELEIVETTVMHDLGAAARRMLDCTRLGVRFALDDFGTGYASLTYFRRLPVSLLKIDRSFVADILDDAEDQALVRSIVAMARSFGRVTVAEGVETLEHGLPLLRYGCDFAQGFGIARPMPGDEIEPWAAAWRMPEAWTVTVS